MTHPRKGTKPTKSVPRKAWSKIVKLLLETHRGESLPLAAIYRYVRDYAEANGLDKSNHHIEAKTRQVLQRLRDAGLVEQVGRGVWRMPARG